MNAKSKLMRKKLDDKRIHEENQALVRRIYDRKSAFSKMNMDNDYAQSRYYSQIRQNFRP